MMPCVATHKVMRRRAGLLHGPQPRDCERGFDSGPWARAWERSKSLWVANKKGLPSEIGTTTTLRRAPPPPSHDLPYAMTYGVRHDTYRRIPRRAVRWRAPWRGLRGAHRVRCAAPRHTARDATPTATQRKARRIRSRFCFLYSMLSRCPDADRIRGARDLASWCASLWPLALVPARALI